MRGNKMTTSVIEPIYDNKFKNIDEMTTQERVEIAKSLFGILPQITTLEEALDERAKIL